MRQLITLKSIFLEKGGEILVALYKNEPVGVCALLKMNDEYYDYELSKLAVSPKVQGKGIGVLFRTNHYKQSKRVRRKKSLFRE